MTQLTNLDYESIETAVMETARGRWFLAEHKKRNGDTNAVSTPDLLEAISRLEKVVTSIGKDFGTPVATQPQHPAPQSSPAEISDNSNPLNSENMQFFANDEDLFAEDSNALLPNTIRSENEKEVKVAAIPKKAAPTAQQDKTSTTLKSEPLKSEPFKSATIKSEKSEKPDNGRFKIFKMKKKGAPVETPAPLKETTTTAVPEIKPEINHEKNQELPELKQPPTALGGREIPDPTLKPTDKEQDRIVVIRNAGNNDIDIPLAGDFAQELDNLSAKEN